MRTPKQFKIDYAPQMYLRLPVALVARLDSLCASYPDMPRNMILIDLLSFAIKGFEQRRSHHQPLIDDDLADFLPY